VDLWHSGQIATDRGSRASLRPRSDDRRLALAIGALGAYRAREAESNKAMRDGFRKPA